MSTGQRTRPAFTMTGYAELNIGRIHGPAAFLVYSYLDLRMGKNVTAWPSIRTTATATGLSTRTVQDVLNKLIEAGLITKTPGDVSNTNHYTVHVPDPEVYQFPPHPCGNNHHTPVVETSTEVDTVEADTVEVDSITSGKPRDEVWDTLASLWGEPPDDTPARRAFGKVASTYRKMQLSSDEIVLAHDLYKAKRTSAYTIWAVMNNAQELLAEVRRPATIHDIKSNHMRTALTIDLSSTREKLEHQRDLRSNLQGPVRNPHRLSATAGRLGTGD